MAINFNQVLNNLKEKEDYVADKITAFAGSMTFVHVHAVWFLIWILFGLGIFGEKLSFDTFPFGLLTLIVSLEAIFLSTFVMVSQNREAEQQKIQNQLNFILQKQEEQEVRIIMQTLERIADKHGVAIDDLVEKLAHSKKATDMAVEKIEEF